MSALSIRSIYRCVYCRVHMRCSDEFEEVGGAERELRNPTFRKEEKGGRERERERERERKIGDREQSMTRSLTNRCFFCRESLGPRIQSPEEARYCLDSRAS